MFAIDDICTERYMPREALPERRRNWRQRVTISDPNAGVHTFYVDFGEYPDGRLAELFITAQKTGTFVRGILDTLARTISIALQSGTAPRAMAQHLRSQNYPPAGDVEADGSKVETCRSIADYIGQEIEANYGDDGKRIRPTASPKRAGYISSSQWG